MAPPPRLRMLTSLSHYFDPKRRLNLSLTTSPSPSSAQPLFSRAMSFSSAPRYIVVGAGVFGASTAYHLVKRYSHASVSLVDRLPYPCPLAASWDWNKVVRADYGDIFYMEKALEAIQSWRTDPLYKPFYHESGYVKIGDTDLGKRMIENYKQLKSTISPELVEPEELKKRYNGFFSDTNFDGVTEIFVNTKSGWAEAKEALKATIDAAVLAGVKYVEGGVTKLTLNELGGCTGIRMADNSTLEADHVILCTGAGTAKLFADSAPERPELQVDGRMVAAAVITGVVKLNKEDGKPYAAIPVSIHGMAGIQGELMPLTEEDRQYALKFCVDESFKNTCKHEASGQLISMPPDEPDQAQRSPSEGLKARLGTTIKGLIGEKSKSMTVDTYRICWDAITPNQDFVITAHPHCSNLFIATAGSFHGWKFLPTIGSYVVDLVDGKLDPALVKRWAWDRDNKGAAHRRLIPKLELRDL